jgi:SET domain-containing protein
MTYQALPSRLHIKDSPIAGQGCFACEDIPADFFLGMSHIIVDGSIIRTPLGGFINHSDDPNCMKWCEDNKWFIKTLRKIKEGEELFLKYTFYNVT